MNPMRAVADAWSTTKKSVVVSDAMAIARSLTRLRSSCGA